MDPMTRITTKSHNNNRNHHEMKTILCKFTILHTHTHSHHPSSITRRRHHHCPIALLQDVSIPNVFESLAGMRVLCTGASPQPTENERYL
mmetsp:Transcript_22121/g.51017  ORF Transcript_22121/g.51017 Transcript_22121/m.51017 type:complete len:90 (-) Transcript_22121:56-325(-)